jgi:hypothetical protein
MLQQADLSGRSLGSRGNTLGPYGSADAAYLLGKYQWAKRLLAGRELELEQLREQLVASREQHQEMRQQLDRALDQVGQDMDNFAATHVVLRTHALLGRKMYPGSRE